VKKIFLGIVFLSVTVFSNCNKTSRSPADNNSSIVGKWILIQTLVDPGDGSGTWMQANVPNHYFMQFNADNKTIESNIISGSGNLDQYKIINDSTVNLIYSDNDTVRYNYKIDNSSLTLMGGCYEACGLKFTRSN
jgi:hypothetical protein